MLPRAWLHGSNARRWLVSGRAREPPPEAENQRKLFVRAKNNDAAESDNETLAFHFDVREVGADPDTGRPIWAPFIVWDSGYVDITATEAMQAASEQKSPGAREASRPGTFTTGLS